MCHDKKPNSKVQLVKTLFLWGFALITTAAVALGGAGQDPAALLQSGETEVSTDDRMALIAFEKNSTIKDGLRVLAAYYNKNIVPSSKVDGLLGFTKLRNVTFEQALDAVLGADLKYEQHGNLIKVYTAEEYRKIKEDIGRMIYEVFTVYYISAAEAKKLITPVLSNNGRIETTAAAETTFPTGESISSVTGGGDTTAMNDTLVVFDYPENIQRIAELLAEIDVRPKQVLIEATILSVRLTEDMQFGIDWSTLRGALSQIPGVTAQAGDIARNSPDFFRSAGTSQVIKTGGLTIGFARENIAAFIQAVEEVTDVTILANPKILAVNKQLGQVYIGKKIGYRSQQTVSQDTQLTQQVEFLDTGTKLSFRPYIANDGYIRMDIHPKDSSGDLKQDLPEETSAELVTNIIVKDGQTVIIGGLFRDKVTTGRTQVPLLGNLPIVGVVFRGKADSVERQEVMVMLTPHIIEEPGETNGDERNDDIRRKRFGAQDGMQLIGRARLAEECYAKAAKYYVEGYYDTALNYVKLALMLRPTYLEALRLKENVLAKLDPDKIEKMDRIIQEDIEQQDAPNWIRR